MISHVGFKASGALHASSKKSPVPDRSSRPFTSEAPSLSEADQSAKAPEKDSSSKGYVMHVTTSDGMSGVLYYGKDILAAVGGAGGTVNVKYHETSTEDDPIVIAWGVDSKGKEYEEIIHLNDVDASHATPAEMIALNAHLSRTGRQEQSMADTGALWNSLGMGNNANSSMDFEQHFKDYIAMQQPNKQSRQALCQLELERCLFFEWQKEG